MPIEAGDRISTWEVVRPIGAGGMGSVYLCRDALGTALRAAVKVNDLEGEDARRRFMREVEALAAVRHPGIVELLGWGEDEERGLLWFAMEMLEGDNLEDRMERGPMPLDEARPLFVRLARALQHAASHGISHRDVKPANVVLGPDGPRLVDFGIAIHEDRTRLTTAGQVPGTPLYMAPEIFEGDDPDPRLGDIYALGLILWEALTGRSVLVLPETLSGQQRFARVVSHKLNASACDPGPDFPEGVREAVRRSTDPDPDTRLADWDLFVDLLEGRHAALVTPAPAARRWLGPVLFGAVGVGALALVGLGLVAVGAWVLWPQPELATPVAVPAPVEEPVAEPIPEEPSPEEPVATEPVVVQPSPGPVATEPAVTEPAVTEPPPEPQGTAEPGPGELRLTRTGGAPVVVRLAEVVLARREGVDTVVQTTSGPIRCEQTITDLDAAVDDGVLLRVHRDYLVNASFVTAIEADEGGTWATTRAGRAPVGVLQVDALRQAAGLLRDPCAP